MSAKRSSFPAPRPAPTSKTLDATTAERFLEVFRKCGRVAEAAQAVGTTAHQVAKMRKSDLYFADEFLEAKALFNNRLERAAYRRAVRGVLEPVFGKDGQVGERRVFSDRLLERMLEANDPEKYGRRVQADLNVRAGILAVTQQLTPEQWAEKFGAGLPAQDGGTIGQSEEQT